MKNKKSKRYISVEAVCECNHLRKCHIVDGKRPTRKRPIFASCGKGSYPIHYRYKGKCRFCKCNKFKLKKSEKQKQC